MSKYIWIIVDLNLIPRVFVRVLQFSSLSKIDSQLIPSFFHLAVVLCCEVTHGLCSGAERLTGSMVPLVRPRRAVPFAIQSQTARKGD